MDKVSSKTSSITINIGEEKVFQNLLINVLKCQNSKFDDSPEITAYMQVTDLKSTNNVKINSILSNFRINIINDNNIQKPAIFYETGNKTEQILIENITDNSLNNAYSEDEIKHYFTIAKHIHYFYEQIKERKNEFNT